MCREREREKYATFLSFLLLFISFVSGVLFHSVNFCFRLVGPGFYGPSNERKTTNWELDGFSYLIVVWNFCSHLYLDKVTLALAHKRAYCFVGYVFILCSFCICFSHVFFFVFFVWFLLLFRFGHLWCVCMLVGVHKNRS